MSDATPPVEKPRLRGVLHYAAAWFMVGAGAVLVALCSDLRTATAAGVYALSLTGLFGTSAIYHRVHWKTPSTRGWMRRADHASIFLLIAGTYTPVAMLGIGGADGRRLLLQIWTGATAGVLLSLLWPRAPKPLVAAVAVAVGWTILPYFPQVLALLGNLVWLILAGGIAYTAGAIVYAIKKPDPWPRVFGYHEVFHTMTVIGALLHLAAVVAIVRE